MKRFGNVLVVCDDTPATESAVQKAVWLARANSVRVTLIDVMEATREAIAARLAALVPARAEEIAEQVVSGHRARLEEYARLFREAGTDVTTRLAQGVEFVEVIRHVQAAGHDLVIKGAAEGGQNTVFASTDMHLMRKCPCPVWMIHPGQPDRARRIVAAVDPDPADDTRAALNRAVMELAVSLAAREGAALHVLAAWRMPEETALRSGRFGLPEEELDRVLIAERGRVNAALEALAGGFEECRDRMTVTLQDGFAGTAIPAYATENQIDTIVMGSVGRTGLRGYFIGNTAETILSSVECSVLAVKPPEFQSPIGPER